MTPGYGFECSDFLRINGPIALSLDDRNCHPRVRDELQHFVGRCVPLRIIGFRQELVLNGVICFTDRVTEFCVPYSGKRAPTPERTSLPSFRHWPARRSEH